MNEDIKTELHKLIDDCDNELLLHETKELLLPENKMKDWWDELTEDDKNLLLQSEKEYEQGIYTSHTGLMQQFESWKKK